MIILYPTGTVTQFYGRSPLIVPEVSQQYAIAPHMPTTRWTYTVPAGRNAIVTSLALWAYRNTVAGTLGSASVNVYVTSGGAPQLMFFLPIMQNVIGSGGGIFLGNCLTLLAGHTIQMDDSDASVTGTCSFYALAQIVEFTP